MHIVSKVLFVKPFNLKCVRVKNDTFGSSKEGQLPLVHHNYVFFKFFPLLLL